MFLLIPSDIMMQYPQSFLNEETPNMKRTVFTGIGIVLCVSMMTSLLAGCSPKEPDTVSTLPPISTGSSDISSASTPAGPEQSSQAPVEMPEEGQTATLYIGTKASGFQEYSLIYEGSLTPETLIQGIADLTGWDLTLAEAVTMGKGGISVCLASTSSLFVGPPNPQKDEFHMYDAGQLAETILDSIQKTLQMGFTGEGGDPDTLDIWYYMEDEKPLELPDIGRSWPIDQPYQWTVNE